MSKKPPAAAAAPQSLGERIGNAPTPTRLKAFMYGIWGVAALLFVVGALMLYGARYAIKTVGLDTAPSIIYAQQISASLADLDANAGNFLIGTKKNQDDAMKSFEAQRVTVTEGLVKAAQNITFESEKAPIFKLFDNLGRYLEYFSEMRYRKSTGDQAGAVAVYLNATDLMHQQMLPAADALDKANFEEMEKEYETQQARSSGAELIAGLIVALLAFALGWAQLFLFRRARRVLNVPLVAASVITVAFGVYLVATIAAAREDLRVAKKDAFDSIHALWQASAIAYDANGDESRYILGGTRAASFEQAYKDKVKRLTTTPEPPAATLAIFRKSSDPSQVPKSYQGFFAAEMRNITFAGERAAAVKMIEGFAEYDKVDGDIRAAERAGRHADAVELCIGTGDKQSNATFARFDKALQQVVAINRKQFDDRVEHGMSSLLTAGIILPVTALLVSFLALFGIRRRLREYAA